MLGAVDLRWIWFGVRWYVVWFAVVFIAIVGFGCLVYETLCFALMFGGSGVGDCGWVVVWSLLAVVLLCGIG